MMKRVAMPCAGRLYAPRGTVHVVARCNNREFSVTTGEDCDLRLAHLQEMVRTYEVTLYAYTLMANHVHLLLQAPKLDALGRPLRWCMTETAKAFYRRRGRRGHCRERHSGTLRLLSADPRLEAQDRRWTWQVAVGSTDFLRRYIPQRGRRRSVPVPPQVHALGA